ncbi:nucleotidyl transferase AbiEii/AbiGii toxin family protein [Olivibacter sp. XZL3]|uniref:nucleotidyl transferase AbiEii/AbiGii toxin family protein n=1 Tax=Olivibacter sp. XZL3 TaxID=1735116 RepID=UPI0010655EC8|nr:nucleotidyl transferase AbiEii/AbiGii toxin family protein [Olivibacter sp. XZL3]
MLYWNTVNDLLRQTLLTLMQAPILADFRLVGGTALSLHLGHRMSVDIDLFTDGNHGSVDFEAVDQYLLAAFPFVQGDIGGLPGFGRSYLIGNSPEDHIKLDVYYSQEKFIWPLVELEGVRLASLEDIIAMKVDVVSRGGRKKDFWDIHELMGKYLLSQMLLFHEERHPYVHDRNQIISNFENFKRADEDFDPICLRGKYWEFIKDDIIEAVRDL